MSALENTERDVALLAIAWLRGIERASAEAATGLSALLADDVDGELIPTIRGPWQRKIARLPGLSVERGLTASEVASEVEYDEANTYTVLAALEKSGLLEQVDGAAPKRWRLGLKHRRDRILRASRVIGEGEWTTYGDIAVAVGDNVRLARSVASVAAKNPAFANPHRVLLAGGKIAPVWRDDEDRGPEECERRLREEGVLLRDDGTAFPNRRIGYEEIKERLAAQDDEGTLDLVAA